MSRTATYAIIEERSEFVSWALFVLVLSVLVPFVSYGFGAADGRGDKSVWQAVF